MAQSVPQQSVLDDNSALENVSRIGTPQRPGGAKINLTPVLGVIDEILSWANKSISDVLDGKFDKNILTSKTVPAGSSADAIGSLASVINKISCELQCKCSGGDANKSTTVILDMLKDYQSGTKAVIAIAAFVLKYGEFCLFAQLDSGHPLARYLRILELLPNIAAHRYTLERLFELIEVIVKLAKEMVQLDDLNDKYFSEDILPRKNAMSNIDDYAKVVISSVVVCTEQIASLAGVSTEITTLSSVEKLIKQAKRELIFMQPSLSRCRDVIEENQSEKIGKKLEDAHSLGEVLAIIFNLEQTTLIRCKESTEKQEMTVLLKKRVLILISYLDIREVEIDSLSKFYKKWQGESETEQQTEIVWLPVKETGTSWCHTKVEDVRRSMPWCTIKEPNLIKEKVFSYIKQQWHTQRKTSLVVLDSAGKVQSKDFLEMLWMWGSSVKKFSQIDEKALWKKYNSVFKLIFCRVGYEINLDEVNNGKKIVCFYGGEDIDWIKKFTELASTVAEKKGSTIDLTYVGKSFHPDKVKDNIKVIEDKKIGTTWSRTIIWQFWTSLNSIFYSRTKITSEIKMTSLQEITSLLTLDSNDKGWAVFYAKSEKLVKVRGDDAVSFLESLLENWKPDDSNKNLVSEIETKFPVNENNCHHFFAHEEIKAHVPCYCGQNMERSSVYKCCHGRH